MLSSGFYRRVFLKVIILFRSSLGHDFNEVNTSNQCENVVETGL